MASLRKALHRFLERPYDPSISEQPVRIKKGDRMTPSEGVSLAELAKRSPIAQAIADLVFEPPASQPAAADAEPEQKPLADSGSL